MQIRLKTLISVVDVFVIFSWIKRLTVCLPLLSQALIINEISECKLAIKAHEARAFPFTLRSWGNWLSIDSDLLDVCLLLALIRSLMCSFNSLMCSFNSLMTSFFLFDYDLRLVIDYYNILKLQWHNNQSNLLIRQQLLYCFLTGLVNVSWWIFDRPSRYWRLFGSWNFRNCGSSSVTLQWARVDKLRVPKFCLLSTYREFLSLFCGK